MYLTPQLSISIRLRKIRNPHVQSEVPKCLKCVAGACGAHGVSRSEPREDVGAEAGMLEMTSGEEHFTPITACKDPRPHHAPPRGHQRDSQRQNAAPGMPGKCTTVTSWTPAHFRAGASETAVAPALREKSTAMTGMEQWPDRAVAPASQVTLEP